MKKLLLILFSALSLTTIGQEYVQVYYPTMLKEMSSVEIPGWFTDISEGSFVGISMPNGDKTDAIGMALIQRLFAMDVEVVYDGTKQNKTIQSDKVIQSKWKASVSFSLESDFNYELQDLLKLPSGEYVCRLTDGNKNSMHIKITFNEYESIFSSKTRQGEKDVNSCQQKKVNFEYGDRTYNMMTNENHHNDSTSYKSMYIGIGKMYGYEFTNDFSNIGNEDLVRTPYVFSSGQIGASWKDDAYFGEGIYYYTITPQKCLAEQLLAFYMDMIRKALPDDNSSGHIVRKKTPIVSQQYDDGIFIIKTTKEE